MLLPAQNKPVPRKMSRRKIDPRVGPSSEPACSICMLACNGLDGWQRAACQIACQQTVCR